MNKFFNKLASCSLLLAIPMLSFAAISEQDKINFMYKYGNSEIKSEIYNKLWEFCDKNSTDITSCLDKLKAKESVQKLSSNESNYGGYCCLNVSGFFGEYAFIQGQAYCIPPCNNLQCNN